jgi:hypothetical protein
MAGLGAALLHWWEPRAAAVTLNGSNISASANLVGGGPALSQGTAGNQPAWVNDGSGPGGRPVVHMHDSVRRMTAALTERAAGHRTGVYVVVSHSTADAAAGRGHSPLPEGARAGPDAHRRPLRHRLPAAEAG